MASFVALIFVACGGGDGKNNPLPDGGGGDGHIVQFDGGQKDGQQDGTTPQQDGGGSTTCATSGGKATDGLCKFTSDCACPGHCTSIFSSTTVAGSCNPACAATTDCTGSGEQCIGMPDSQGICVSVGTITGTGLTNIPLIEGQPALPFTGTGNVILAVDDINVTFSVGFASKSTDYYLVMLMPGTADAPDETKRFIIMCDVTDWSAKAYDLNTGNCQVSYAVMTYNQSTGALTSWTDMVFAISGTLTLTAAPTTTGQPVQGTFSNAAVFKLVQEECGTNSGPC